MRMCVEKNSLGNPKQKMTEQNKNNNTPTNQNFPILAGLCHLVGTPHFGVSHAPNHEYDKPRSTLVASLALVFMPVSIPSTANKQHPCRETLHHGV